MPDKAQEIPQKIETKSKNPRRNFFLMDLADSEETKPNYLTEGGQVFYGCNEDGLHLFEEDLKDIKGVDY